MKGSLCPRETFHYEGFQWYQKLSGKTNFAISYDLAEIRNRGRCIFSLSGESRKTKSDVRELKMTLRYWKMTSKCWNMTFSQER